MAIPRLSRRKYPGDEAREVEPTPRWPRNKQGCQQGFRFFEKLRCIIGPRFLSNTIIQIVFNDYYILLNVASLFKCLSPQRPQKERLMPYIDNSSLEANEVKDILPFRLTATWGRTWRGLADGPCSWGGSSGRWRACTRCPTCPGAANPERPFLSSFCWTPCRTRWEWTAAGSGTSSSGWRPCGGRQTCIATRWEVDNSTMSTRWDCRQVDRLSLEWGRHILARQFYAWPAFSVRFSSTAMRRRFWRDATVWRKRRKVKD